MVTGQVQDNGRTPQGVRGLKLVEIIQSYSRQMSHSARNAWIETSERLAMSGFAYLFLKMKSSPGLFGLESFFSGFVVYFSAGG